MKDKKTFLQAEFSPELYHMPEVVHTYQIYVWFEDLVHIY